MEPQLPCCLVCSNRGCCQSHSDPAILQGSEGRGQWGDAGIVGRCGVNRPGPVTCPTWKQKVVTSSPGKFSDASKVADLDFRSMVRRHLSYNSLSSWRAERDTEDMRSFCYLGENRGERWPQSRVIGAFQRHGIWITMLTMWRHPVTPGKTTKTRKLLPVNLEIFDFVTDTGEVTGWVAAGRWQLMVVVPSPLLEIFTAAVNEFLSSCLSQWDLVPIVRQRHHWLDVGPRHQSYILAGRAMHMAQWHFCNPS